MFSQFACLCQFFQVTLDSEICCFLVALGDFSLGYMSDFRIGCAVGADWFPGSFSVEDMAWRVDQCRVNDQFPVEMKRSERLYWSGRSSDTQRTRPYICFDQHTDLPFPSIREVTYRRSDSTQQDPWDPSPQAISHEPTTVRALDVGDVFRARPSPLVLSLQRKQRSQALAFL
jgi:hypothetical protein